MYACVSVNFLCVMARERNQAKRQRIVDTSAVANKHDCND